MSRARGWTLSLLALALGAVPVQGTTPAKHPRLVSLEQAQCTQCHGEILGEVTGTHPPAAEDCKNCHVLSVAESGTTVALTEPEPALCLGCHDELAPAAAGEVKSPHFPTTESCLTCHSPHASAQPRLLLAPVPQLCTDCHEAQGLAGTHGGQITATTNCLECHRPHGSANPRLLRASQLHPPFAEGSCAACHRPPMGNRLSFRARGEKLCTSCHGLLAGASAGAGSVHTALKGQHGRPGCLNCHTPHMSDTRGLLLQPSPLLCGRCHAPIVEAANAETGHAPAADDCLTCHQPHSSPQPRLLVQPAEELCATCHDAGDPGLAKAHLGADPRKLTCLQCHTPHGSGNPKLLARTIHPPLLDGCDTCHGGAFDQLEEDGESALCLICHDDIGEQAAKAAVPHPALEVARCADCHNPHASPQDRLIKSPGAGPCAECHEEQVAGPGEVAHGVIQLLGCRACHEPHGGSEPKLLRKPVEELCRSCHDPGKLDPSGEATVVQLLDRFPVPAERAKAIASLRLSADGRRGHPVVNHRVSGKPSEAELKTIDTTFQGELTCLTCHDPHKSKSKFLFRWGATSTVEACLKCHPK